MAAGTVKWFDGKKGYGFITQESGEDVFVHCSSISSPSGDGRGFRNLAEGERVEFEHIRGEKGLQAVKVQRVARIA